MDDAAFAEQERLERQGLHKARIALTRFFLSGTSIDEALRVIELNYGAEVSDYLDAEVRGKYLESLRNEDRPLYT